MKLGLIGIKRDIDISIREKFSILDIEKEEKVKQILDYVDEVIILNTCNRTEIYVNYCFDEDELIKIIFDILEWPKELQKYTFYSEGDRTIQHIFEVSCGYHSKITGEDQILGQVRNAYFYSKKLGACLGELGRLFQDAIACGKKFRYSSKLYEIPVSSISIVINKFIQNNVKNVMVLGFGQIGQLAVKYLLQNDFQNIYLVLRNKLKATCIEDSRVKILTFDEKNAYINDVEGIISCTSAPHTVVKVNEINKKGNNIYCFDMAVPRDIDEDLLSLDRIKAFNIDEISSIDDNNRKHRIQRMKENKYIINAFISEYKEWLKVRKIVPYIVELKDNSENIYSRRINTFKNKKKTNLDMNLASSLIKSTSDYYLHRAIELLKEEQIKGCEDECMKILRKIFIREK